ncbi:putative ATP-dependent RNA helicase DDX58 [Turdus rufiventris]|nr:putative ATP-dependent RNA helicase DDX58 [Turdus rufiventris]
MTAEEKRSLQCYRRYIERSLNPVHVLSNMTDWLSDGYTGLAEAIENWDFSKLEKLELHRQLLKRIEATMLEVDPVVIMPYINTCLIERDCDEILQISEYRSKAAGITKLIECLCRSDKENWPKSLQLALDSAGYYNASELWNIKEDNGKDVDAEMTDTSENYFETVMTFSEETECDNLSENLSSVSESANESSSVYTPKKARSYQIELAQPAIDGKNTLICAPTGSGKTFVALLICEHHLQNVPSGQKAKIVFLATKVPVYEQQTNVFRQHFERSGYSVQGICGETVANISVESVIRDSDIIVLTPQILVNSMEKGILSSLSIFTLMIFDECHNTTGNHPYNVLMTRYLDQKFDSSANQLPQIVGLTASVGVGNAKSTDETIEHICTLCSYLDIQAISTVRKNKEDLQRFGNKPETHIRWVKMRAQNHFADIISGLMSETEVLMRKIYSVDTIPQMNKNYFGTQRYEQWIVSTQKKCRLLQLEDKEKESCICRDLFICTEHLRQKFNDALIISEDARIEDALAYLNEFFTNVKNGPFTELEKELTQKFQEKELELTALSKDESNENPKLEELACILDDAYRYNPETRTILFAKTRALVAALKKWIEANPVLSHIKPDVLMGRARRDDKTGMTLPKQKVVLDAFRNDKDIRLLIATSVADEGIDITECNLVVLYEYFGNVTKMIQVRGRGRAKGSKCILVTSKTEVVENEKLNCYKEEMMNAAIEKLQNWDETTFARTVCRLQKREKVLRDSRKNEKREVVKGKKNLLCGKCKVYVCSTDDIRIIKESHHTVLGDTFKERYITKPHRKPVKFDDFLKKSKMHCQNAECQHDWGITVKYKTFDNLPVIKIKSFVLEDVETGTQMEFQKWKSINLSLKNFDEEAFS